VTTPQGIAFAERTGSDRRLERTSKSFSPQDGFFFRIPAGKSESPAFSTGEGVTIQPIPGSLRPMVSLGLGELAGLEHPYILGERMFPAALLQSFYLRNDLVQDVLIGNNA
jgi:hypothetical protein